MSVRTNRLALAAAAEDLAVQQADEIQLGEGANSFSTTSADHPLTRRIVVNIRSTLGELCRNSGKAAWTPTSEVLRTIMQQKKYTDLKGASAAEGDLKSVILHDITAANVKTTFPIPVGAHITGVDANTYSISGRAFGMVVPSNHTNATPTILQQEDVSVAYDFAKTYPGCTSQASRTPF
jgi:hypothetical protein